MVRYLRMITIAAVPGCLASADVGCAAVTPMDPGGQGRQASREGSA